MRHNCPSKKLSWHNLIKKVSYKAYHSRTLSNFVQLSKVSLTCLAHNIAVHSIQSLCLGIHRTTIGPTLSVFLTSATSSSKTCNLYKRESSGKYRLRLLSLILSLVQAGVVRSNLPGFIDQKSLSLSPSLFLTLIMTLSLVLSLTLSLSLFSELESLGLLVACLCHDVDHRGTNNSFQVVYFVLQNDLPIGRGSQ